MIDKQATIDAEHVRLLSIFHYVYAGLMVLTSCFFGIYIALGISIANGALPQGANPNQPGPRELGMVFAVGGTCFLVSFLALSLLIFFAGRKLGQRSGRTFCIVIAGIECLFFPLGSVLGVFTLIVLMRPGVKDVFEGRTRPEAYFEPLDDEATITDPPRNDPPPSQGIREA